MSSDPAYPRARWGFVVLGTNLPLSEGPRKDLLMLACRTYRARFPEPCYPPLPEAPTT